MSQLYRKCDLCDYKGTVRVKDVRGLTGRRDCPACEGSKFVPIGLTAEQANALIAASHGAMALEWGRVDREQGCPLGDNRFAMDPPPALRDEWARGWKWRDLEIAREAWDAIGAGALTTFPMECEHGIPEAVYCPDRNAEYKAAAADPENGFEPHPWEAGEAEATTGGSDAP